MTLGAWRIDYEQLADELLGDDLEGLAEFGAAISGLWCEHYPSFTPWKPEVVEITLGALTYLFDLAPSRGVAGAHDADDRVVGVWGRAGRAAAARDTTRQRGFVPRPAAWSERGYDRGHFVAHSLGGGMDINFFPQARELNRGWSAEGRRWREMEHLARAHENAALFVRPIYETPTWVPSWLEFGVVTEGVLELEQFDNRPGDP